MSNPSGESSELARPVLGHTICSVSLIRSGMLMYEAARQLPLADVPGVSSMPGCVT